MSPLRADPPPRDYLLGWKLGAFAIHFGGGMLLGAVIYYALVGAFDYHVETFWLGWYAGITFAHAVDAFQKETGP